MEDHHRNRTSRLVKIRELQCYMSDCRDHMLCNNDVGMTRMEAYELLKFLKQEYADVMYVETEELLVGMPPDERSRKVDRAANHALVVIIGPAVVILLLVAIGGVWGALAGVIASAAMVSAYLGRQRAHPHP